MASSIVPPAVPAHAGAHAGPHLPVPLDVAVPIVAAGGLVFGVIAYDIYRRHWEVIG